MGMIEDKIKDEYMKNTLKEIEAQKIISSINSGLKDIKDANVHPIDTLWDQLDG
jgi:serine/threonine-protein kinase RIO1